MTRLASLIAVAATALVCSTAEAQAGFLVPFVAAALGIGKLAAGIIVAVGATAASIGASYLVSKLTRPKPQAPAQSQVRQAYAGGVQFDLAANADEPQWVGVGRFVTPGSLIYCETTGVRGEIDNSDMGEVIALADHPCQGLVEVRVEEQLVTLGSDDGYLGRALAEYVDPEIGPLLASRFYGGSQVAADQWMRDKFGFHSERPYVASMIGRGVTYIRNSYKYHPERVPGPLRGRYVLDGFRLYDPRFDSTVGGAGAQRFPLLGTHVFTQNPIVILYNVLRGMRVAAGNGVPQHFYGLQRTKASQLPLSNWFAAMNEADAAGYTIGGAWPATTPVAEIVRAIEVATGGRFTEFGGIYKFHLGAPGLPVLTLDEESLRADKGGGQSPVLPLDQRINHVTGSYTRPEDGWIKRVAPVRHDAAAEARDGRRVSVNLDNPMVQRSHQQQQVMDQALKRAQRQRRETMALPPAAFGAELCDVFAFTAPGSGFIAKRFEVDAVEVAADLSSVVTLTEVDPADFVTPPEAIQPEADGSITVILPAPKIVSNFAVTGIAHQGTNNTSRPAIEVSWTPPADADIVAAEIEWRLAAQPLDVAHARSENPRRGKMIIVGGVQPLTNYEVRGQFVSAGGWRVERTLWLPVFTPDVRLSQNDFDRLINARLAQLDRDADAAISRSLDELFGRTDSLAHYMMGIGGKLEEQDQRYQISAGARMVRQEMALATETSARAEAILTLESAVFDPETGLPAVAGAVDGLITEVDTIDGELTALATAFTNVFAENSEGEAAAMIRLSAQAAPVGVAARIALEAKTEAGIYGANSAGLFLDVVAGVGSRFVGVGDRFQFQRPGGSLFPLFSFGGEIATLNSAIRINGAAIIDGTLTVNGDAVINGTLTAEKIITNEIARTYSAVSGASGTINSNEIETVISIPGVHVDARCAGMLICGQIAGGMFVNAGALARVNGQIRFSTGQLLVQDVCSFYLPSGSPDVNEFAKLNFSAVVPKSELANGTYTVQMVISVLGSGPFTWGGSGQFGPGRLGVVLPRA